MSHIDMNETVSGLFARRSVRVFTDEPVADDVKSLLFSCAAEAPTAGNQQLYTIIDVCDPAVKEALSHLCDEQPFIATAPVVLVFVADCRKWLSAYRGAGIEAREPGVGDLLLAVSDATIAAQNVVTAAWSLGIGSCYIGDVMERREEVRELLALPDETFPCCMLVLGHPTRKQLDRTKPPRMPESAFVCRDRYSDPGPEAMLSALESRVPAGQDVRDWTAAFCRRKYESGFAAEMNRSVAAYLEQFERKRG